MTAQEAIQNALNSIALAAQNAGTDYPYDALNVSTTLPVADLTQHGFTVQVLEDDDADILPHLLVQSGKGDIEVERSPFASLALLSSQGNWDGAEIPAILQRAGITALKLDHFAAVPDWQGVPAVSWLFPQRLSDAFSLLDALRGRAEL